MWLVCVAEASVQRYVTTFQDKIYLGIKKEISLLQIEAVQFLPFYRYRKIFHFTTVPPVCFLAPLCCLAGSRLVQPPEPFPNVWLWLNFDSIQHNIYTENTNYNTTHKQIYGFKFFIYFFVNAFYILWYKFWIICVFIPYKPDSGTHEHQTSLTNIT